MPNRCRRYGSPPLAKDGTDLVVSRLPREDLDAVVLVVSGLPREDLVARKAAHYQDNRDETCWIRELVASGVRNSRT
jgi:hypothetical protein